MSNIVLIGGSYGIGRAIAEAQAAKGHAVWVASRSMDDPITGVDHIHFDALSESPDFTHFPSEIDALVYCPGSINLRPFGSLKEDAFRKDMEINFFSMVRTVQGLLSHVKNASSPSIVLFSTVAVQTGLPFHTSIAAAKGAVEGFTRALAAEMAPKVRVNCIAPSLTDTPLASKLTANEKSKDASAQRHPLKRIGTAEDIANAADFLINDTSSWMTGQVLHVDGGMGSLQI
jgi:3-oxoacyl-[acyl-carrier protein] reductase